MPKKKTTKVTPYHLVIIKWIDNGKQYHSKILKESTLSEAKAYLSSYCDKKRDKYKLQGKEFNYYLVKIKNELNQDVFYWLDENKL